MEKTKEKVLKDHLLFKRTSVNSRKLKDIERYLGRFLEYSKKGLDNYTESDLTGFIDSLNGKFSISSINDIKVYLKVFIKWYYEDYSSRFRNLDRICKNKTPPSSHTPDQMLTEKEVRKIIETEKEFLWKTYFSVFYYGGFRPSEACSLKWENVEFEKDGAFITIRTGKTNKDFVKFIPYETAHYLKKWKESNTSEWVFPSPIKSGQHIISKSVYHRLKKISKEALGKEIFPYTLRHSLATEQYNNDGKKEDDVANQLGHSKSMKPKYTHLDIGKIKARARKFYVTKEDLPQEKEHELENKIEEQDKQIKALINTLKETIPLIKGFDKMDKERQESFKWLFTEELPGIKRK